MPLFHGIDVAIAHSHTTEQITDISPILWLMLLFFVLPMGAIVATAFWDSLRYRMAHFQLTIVYTVMNFLHVALDLTVTPIQWFQIALMLVLFANGILLNIVAWRWAKETSSVERNNRNREPFSSGIS